MVRTYKSVTKNIRLCKFLEQENILNVGSLKYKTLEKTTEYIDYYGWNDVNFYGIGQQVQASLHFVQDIACIYKLNNGSK